MYEQFFIHKKYSNFFLIFFLFVDKLKIKTPNTLDMCFILLVIIFIKNLDKKYNVRFFTN